MTRIVAYLALGVMFAAGCNGPANKYDAVVTGTVTIDGELANNGTVTFHPIDDGKVAVGRIHPDGSYSLRTGQGDLNEVDGGTVVSGDYIVTVSVTGPSEPDARVGEGGPLIPGPSLVAAKYASQDTSDLKRTVKPGPQIFVLELEKAEPKVEEAAAAEGDLKPGEGDAAAEPAANQPEQSDPAGEAPAAAESASENSVEASQQ